MDADRLDADWPKLEADGGMIKCFYTACDSSNGGSRAPLNDAH
jgi:hypothetical protein